jgi:hypothetical protein
MTLQDQGINDQIILPVRRSMIMHALHPPTAAAHVLGGNGESELHPRVVLNLLDPLFLGKCHRH